MGTHGPKEPVEPRYPAIRTGLALLRPRAWLVFLIGGLGLAIAGLLIRDELALLLPLTAVGLLTTVAIEVGIRMHRPARRLPWHLLAVSILITTIAATFDTETGQLGFLSQSMTGVGSLAGIVGLAILVRGRIPGGDRTALLDAAILASGIGVLIWAFGIGPYVLASGQNSLVLAAFFYPALIAFATVARMWFLPGAHRPTTRLIVLFVFAANALIVMQLVTGLGGQDVSGPYLLAGFAVLTFVASAALHPSMAIVPDRQRVDLGPIGRGRMVALGAALLVNPATLAIEVAIGRPIDPAP